MAKQRRKLFNQEAFLNRPDIKEHTAYLVDVSFSTGNPIHRAILFIGFKTGGYCEVYINNYDQPVPLDRVYYLQVVKELCSLYTPIIGELPPKLQNAEPLGSDW